ncbi:MAG TPA: nuclear transport factor 2 family protein [Rhizomicrobium sp.]|nr:nuclear transport factor 2 family protein [Rhizomicrobium sp.]
MSASPVSRRALFEAGTGALAGTALWLESSGALASTTSANEALIRRWYGLWATEKKNWSPYDEILADDFTFTSPAPDDHISKAAFKKSCWETQVNFIRDFDLEVVAVKGDEVLVKYLCRTQNGKSFRNVEYFRLRDGKIAALECYFGGNMTFPSSVSAQKT